MQRFLINLKRQEARKLHIQGKLTLGDSSKNWRLFCPNEVAKKREGSGQCSIQEGRPLGLGRQLDRTGRSCEGWVPEAGWHKWTDDDAVCSDREMNMGQCLRGRRLTNQA